MHLSVYTDYSLRLLMYLAGREDRPATIAETAAQLQVSRNHLMKIVFRLGRGGYIRTLRGKSGGFRLARPPAEIGLGDVVRFTEADMVLVPCFEAGKAACTFLPDCELRRALQGALAAFAAVLDQYSIADLTRKQSPLHGLLSMAQEPAGMPTPSSPALQTRRSAKRKRAGAV